MNPNLGPNLVHITPVPHWEYLQVCKKKDTINVLNWCELFFERLYFVDNWDLFIEIGLMPWNLWLGVSLKYQRWLEYYGWKNR